jgi:patatin-like phospholipase/acyl hydrolase
MKQYQIENITDDLHHEIVLPEVWEQNKFSELTFTNTRASGSITMDLYVKDVILDSSGALPVYYLLKNVVIPIVGKIN